MSIEDDIDDLIGSGGSEQSRAASRAERKRREFEERIASAKQADDADADIGAIRNGVTASWLAQALGMSLGTVRVKLANCPSTRRNKFLVFSLAEALPYLIKPRYATDFKNLKKEDLPLSLQESYWSAMLKRQQWEREAKELWHSEDVLMVFGTAFQAIKFATKLWIDDMEREVAISPAQQKFLVAKVDELQKKIYDELVKIPQQQSTRSSKTMHKDEPVNPQVDDDIADLV